MLKLTRLLVVLALILVACGGDEEAGDDGSDDTGGTETTTTTTTSAPTTTTTVVSSSGGGGDFCDFVAQQAQTVTPSPVGLNPAEVEENFTEILATITMAADLAPGEIQSDVQLFVDAYGGLVGFLSEYEFNFLAIPEADLDDPRLNALEDPELEAAGDRIEVFCGIDSFIETPPAGGAPPQGGDTGGGPLPGTGLSDTFPADLVPPDGELLATVTVSGNESATWELTTPLDESITFYTDLLGPPTGTTPEGAIWVTEFEGRQLNVVVADADGFISVNVIIGQ